MTFFIFYLANTPTQSLRDISGLNLIPGNILEFENVKRATEGVDYIFHMAASKTFDPRKNGCNGLSMGKGPAMCWKSSDNLHPSRKCATPSLQFP
jgi:hypothetical protein